MSEVFPTVCRLTACAFSFIPGRLFLIFYSYVMHVGAEQLPWISPFCMATMAVSSAIGALALPDTRKTVLLSSIAETEAFYQQEPTILAKTFKRVTRRITPSELEAGKSKEII